MTTTAGRQTSALLALRWRMVRHPGVRAGLVLVLVAALVVLVLGALVAAGVPLGPKVDSTDPWQGLRPGGPPPDRTDEIALLLPTAMMAFLLTSILGPVVAGGAYELLPTSTLVAFPVRTRTLVRASLLLSPLNIAWFLQLVLLVAATGYAIRGPAAPVLPVLVLLAFALAATTTGHAVAWVLAGVRRTRAGRVATRAALVLAVLATLWVVRTDRVTDLLDSSPTVRVLAAQLLAAQGAPAGTWLPTVVGLLALAVLGYLAAVATAGWTTRRPGDRGSDPRTSAPLPRRSAPRSAYGALLAVDRASVWRSPPLRRGLLVLAVLPAAAGALAGLSWTSMTLLPPLVASGAVLLFGVNAMCLDGSGAVWVSTLPHDPALVLRAKRRVVLEVAALAVALVVVACAWRANAAPTPAQLAAVLGCAVSCTLLVTSTALHLSVSRPHRADLQGPRDTPAPPGSMALYSLRLAATTTFLGLLFAALSLTGDPVPPVLLALGLVLWSAWSWRRTAARWRDPVARGRVIATVAAG